MRNQKQGFTLIELMIVIAIIAIIAAIAIPGLLASQRASNERNASASLKTLASAEADFRGNDRDGNKIQDFWTLDIAGLYGITPVGSTEMIKLIEISVAGANFNPQGAAAAATGFANTALLSYSIAAPKAGYWYRALLSDESAVPPVAYAQATNGIITYGGSPTSLEYWNHSKFGFHAFPDSFSSGRSVFAINEGNTIFKRAMNGEVKPQPFPPSATPLLTTGLVGASIAEFWPNDTNLKADYAKLD